MVERVCTEGLYFHRECFRCSTCGSTLRQGAHAFDSEEGSYHHVSSQQYWINMLLMKFSSHLAALC